MSDRKQVDEQLKAHVEGQIIPLYATFDPAHREDHVQTVIEQSLNLAQYYDVDINMVYATAAYHDVGLQKGREIHHEESARIIRSDKRLLQWFTLNEIETIADAAEDHRASSSHVPRTIYGRIVAEADRIIVPEVVIRRTIQYGLGHYPELDKDGQYARFKSHAYEKYGDGGYLKLWIPESPNASRLEDLRKIIRDENLLKAEFEKQWALLYSQSIN